MLRMPQVAPAQCLLLGLFSTFYLEQQLQFLLLRNIGAKDVNIETERGGWESFTIGNPNLRWEEVQEMVFFFLVWSDLVWPTYLHDTRMPTYIPTPHSTQSTLYVSIRLARAISLINSLAPRLGETANKP